MRNRFFYKHFFLAGAVMTLAIALAPLTVVRADEEHDSPPASFENEIEKGRAGLGGAIDLLDIGAKTGAGFPEAREPEVVAGAIIRGALALIAVVFGILVIYGGYLWMTARGNEEQAKKALEILKTSVVGFILVIGAYAITNYIVETVLRAAFQ